jgi:hypothetical protein
MVSYISAHWHLAGEHRRDLTGRVNRSLGGALGFVVDDSPEPIQMPERYDSKLLLVRTATNGNVARVGIAVVYDQDRPFYWAGRAVRPDGGILAEAGGLEDGTLGLLKGLGDLVVCSELDVYGGAYVPKDNPRLVGISAVITEALQPLREIVPVPFSYDDTLTARR